MKEYSYVLKVCVPKDILHDCFIDDDLDTKYILAAFNNDECSHGLAFEITKEGQDGEDLIVFTFILKVFVTKDYIPPSWAGEFEKDGSQILDCLRNAEDEGIAYSMKLLQVEEK